MLSSGRPREAAKQPSNDAHWTVFPRRFEASRAVSANNAGGQKIIHSVGGIWPMQNRHPPWFIWCERRGVRRGASSGEEVKYFR